MISDPNYDLDHVKLSKIIPEFKDNFLYEGLIKSYGIDDVILHSEIWTIKHNFVKNIKKQNDLIVVELNEISEDDFKYLITHYNFFGWFIGIISINNHTQKFNEKNLKLYSDESLNKNIKLYLQAKYDQQFDESTIDFLYHITSESKLEKIKKLGLVPKTSNPTSNYPDRIYFALTYSDALTLAFEFKKMYFKETSLFILKIKPDKNIKFFKDPHFLKSGVYTYQNIKPQSIIEIKNYK